MRDRVAAHGSLDLDAGTMDLKTDVRVARLETFLKPFGVTGIEGRVQLDMLMLI